MDFFSHILIGRALATAPKNSRKNIYLITLFSLLPDLPQITIYLYLGLINARSFWLPFNTDWAGFRALHPIWSAVWEIPHSIFFIFLVLLPIILILKLPKMALAAYILHIFFDLFTHTGEWGIKIFYPLPYQINGFTNTWAWPSGGIFLSWLALLMAIVILHFVLRRKIYN